MSATTSNTTFPPGPPDGFQAFSRDPLNVQMDWWHTYGDIWSIDLPSGKSMVFLAHPDLVEQLFTNHLDHGEMVRRTIPAQGEGITVQDGAEWRRTRLMMQPMFGRPALRSLVALVHEAVTSRLALLERYADTGETFDMSAFLGQITIRVLFHSMFSDEFSEDEIDFAVQQLDAISVYKGQLMSTVWTGEEAVGSDTAGRAAVDALDALLYRVIERRRVNGGSDNDLLGRLLAARGEAGEQFSDKEIRDELTVLFFGGYETTQWGVAWALACLTTEPEALAAVRREADGLTRSTPDFDDVTSMQFTRATFDEALRWQSMVMVPRQLRRDDTFAGYHIAAGTIVVGSAWVIHRRPDLWERPERFDPRRFLGDSRKSQHKYQHIPFGGGARTCLGLNLSYLEAQLILALFLRDYDYAVADGFQARHRHQYSVVIDGGLPVTIRRRTDA